MNKFLMPRPLTNIDVSSIDEDEFLGSGFAFRQWVDRTPPVVLSTNAGSRSVPFQSWHKFKEAFAPELVARAIGETSNALGRRVRRSIDPFGGAGTTALASQFLGVRPTTVEVNPYLADFIRAKLSSYDLRALVQVAALLDSEGIDCGPAEYDLLGCAPPTFVEPGVGGRYIFSIDVATQLAKLSYKIDLIEDDAIARLMRCTLCAISVGVSNVLVSGKGRRYRAKWASRQFSAIDVRNAFRSAVKRAIDDISTFQSRRCLDYTVVCGDSRELTFEHDEFDVSVFSPPYPNSFDYTDVYNVELWVGRYVSTKQAERALRHRTLRSHVQIRRAHDVPPVRVSSLECVSERMKAVRKELWDSTIPEMIESYFADMYRILDGLRRAIVRGGRVYVVVGDSRYHGVHVPVAEILADCARQIGFEVIDSEPFRSMRSSPQQGGCAELSETLLILASP